MNHNYHLINNKEIKQQLDCVCGKECLSCSAEKLSVACGCKMEAKQYEYQLNNNLKHLEHEHKIEISKIQENKLIYICPMHPDVRQLTPGRCPGCGMELIAKYQGVETVEEHPTHNISKISHKDHEAAMTDPRIAKSMEYDMRRRFLISFILSIPIFLYSPAAVNIFGLQLPTPIPVNWLLFILTTPIVFWTGSIFITGTYYSLKAKQLNMAVLIATGVLAAYLFSILLTIVRPGSETFYEAAALLVTFVLFGHWMEMRSRRGTSEALRALFDLVPPQANVIRNGQEIIIPSAEIMQGDIIVIRPGNKIPVDGEIIEGETYIDEALVTGESMPVHKKIGDQVVGGSINQQGSIKFQATKVGSETVLAQIIKMVETAQNSKAPGQRIADKAAAILVIIAISSGLAAFLGWYIFAGAGLITALTFAVSTIVIACPDALGLATPTVVAVGTGLGAKYNILIKDATTLEKTSKINAIIIDKTGTLTKGQPEVTDVIEIQNSKFKNENLKFKILQIAASLEKKSEHPLAKTIIKEALNKNLELFEIFKFEAIPGQGVQGFDKENNFILLGNQRLMEINKVLINDDVHQKIEHLQNDGKTVIILALDKEIIGIIAVADTPRESSKHAITELKKMNIEIIMLTGDNQRTAEAIAKQLGIDRIFAEVLPEDKAKWVKKLQEEGKFVAMVGDGINDAPALAQADIGIAIGAGTDVAIETGNIVLMKSDPYDIVAAIRLSKATVTKMKQNLFWAAIYNVISIPIAAGVFYNSFGWFLRPEFAALLMSASSIIVATNAVLLKRVEPQLKK